VGAPQHKRTRTRAAVATTRRHVGVNSGLCSLTLQFALAHASITNTAAAHHRSSCRSPNCRISYFSRYFIKTRNVRFLRFSIPLFPYACTYFTPLIYTMSVIAIIYTSLTTLRQVDFKKQIAYSSVAHMNFVTIGLFSLNAQGIEGSI